MARAAVGGGGGLHDGIEPLFQFVLVLASKIEHGTCAQEIPLLAPSSFQKCSLPGLKILKANFLDLTSAAGPELNPGRQIRLSAFLSCNSI